MKVNKVNSSLKVKLKIACFTTGVLVGMTGSLLSAQSSYAQYGTGGGNEERDAYLAQLETTLGKQAETPNSPEDDLLAWAKRVSVILRKGKRKALIEIQRANYDSLEVYQKAAERILIDTLTKAAESLTVDPESGGPMTKQLIDRTLKYTQRLDQELPNQGLGLTTKLNFLFNSFEFVMSVERKLDEPFYIPFRYRHHGRYPCGDCERDHFDYGEYQSTFIKVASQELAFLSKALTERSEQDGQNKVFPKGDPKAYLTLVEMASKYVAHDLSINVHGYANGDAIADLTDLSEDLVAYNSNQDPHKFPKGVNKVRDTFEDLEAIRSEIKVFYNQCGYLDYSDDVDYNSDYASGGDEHEKK